MTRRTLNRAILGLLLATAIAFTVLIGLLLAGVDPDDGAVNAALYTLLLLGSLTVTIAAIGDRMAPRRDPDPNRRR